MLTNCMSNLQVQLDLMWLAGIICSDILDFLGARRFLFAAVIAIGFRTKYVFMVLVLDVLIVYH